MAGRIAAAAADSPVGILNTYIDAVLKTCPLSRYKGVYSCDNVPGSLAKDEYFNIICNLDKVGEPGSHFVAIIGRPEGVLYFDPLGLSNCNEHLQRFLELASVWGDKRPKQQQQQQQQQQRRRRRRLFTQGEPIQHPLSPFCGYHCLLMVLYHDRDDHGVVLRGFAPTTRGCNTELHKNDAVCLRYIDKFIRLYRNAVSPSVQ